MDKILATGFIREIKYPEWQANVVVVSKKGGKWRVAWTTQISTKPTRKTVSLYPR